jgi:hypothetical protein
MHWLWVTNCSLVDLLANLADAFQQSAISIFLSGEFNPRSRNSFSSAPSASPLVVICLAQMDTAFVSFPAAIISGIPNRHAPAKTTRATATTSQPAIEITLLAVKTSHAIAATSHAAVKTSQAVAATSCISPFRSYPPLNQAAKSEKQANQRLTQSNR